MNRTLIIFCVTLCCSITTAAFGQIEIAQSSIDGGAGVVTGGNFSLSGTIGQHDASTTSSGGNFSVSGGFDTGQDEVLLGDVNGDGQVDLLDVQAFVEAITNGTFIVEADINGDGFVNLLDVGPFIDILTG